MVLFYLLFPSAEEQFSYLSRSKWLCIFNTLGKFRQIDRLSLHRFLSFFYYEYYFFSILFIVLHYSAVSPKSRSYFRRHYRYVQRACIGRELKLDRIEGMGVARYAGRLYKL